MTSVPAADVEGAVLSRSCWAPRADRSDLANAKREAEDEITEREVVLLADFATVCAELFPPSRRGSCSCSSRGRRAEDALEVQIRAEGLASLVGELRQGERRSA